MKLNGSYQYLMIDGIRLEHQIYLTFSTDMVYVVTLMDGHKLDDFITWQSLIGEVFTLYSEGQVLNDSVNLPLKRVVMTANIEDAIRMTLVFKE